MREISTEKACSSQTHTSTDPVEEILRVIRKQRDYLKAGMDTMEQEMERMNAAFDRMAETLDEQDALCERMVKKSESAACLLQLVWLCEIINSSSLVVPTASRNRRRYREDVPAQESSTPNKRQRNRYSRLWDQAGQHTPSGRSRKDYSALWDQKTKQEATWRYREE